MYINGAFIKVGADPELFLKDKKTGRYISAVGVSSGTKQEPQRLGMGTAVQVDGMALEYNTSPSSNCRDFVHTNQFCKDQLQTIAAVRGLSLAIEPTVEFDDEEWARVPEEAKVLGCESDLNAWTGEVNHPPNAKVKFRTGAGHIHVGWGSGFDINDEYIHVCGEVTKELDATLGVASLLFDGDSKRRELYGKAGAFRPKHYGVEYRVLSNSWVRNQALTEYVYRLTTKAIGNMMFQRPSYLPCVQSIIDSNDPAAATSWMERYSVPLPPEKYRVV